MEAHVEEIPHVDGSPALDEAIAVQIALDRERVPEDPLAPASLYRRWLLTVPPGRRAWIWLARDEGGRAIGSARLEGSDRDNRHMVWGGVGVLPAARRRGIGRMLLETMKDRAAREGRRLIAGGTSDRVPASDAFLASVGAKPGLAMHINQLDLTSVDREHLQAQIERARDRARGYRLAWVRPDAGDDLVVPLARSYLAMNDAPRQDLDFEDEEWTPEKVRERFAFIAQQGREMWSLVAIHEESGEGAGFTETAIWHDFPESVQQQGTAVPMAHRGHGVGMWLKATMLERVVRERTGARFIRTGNADANEPMLRINTELGYRPAWANTLWQLELPASRP